MNPAQVVTTGLAGVVFGLALAAPPGPMNAVIAEESVLRGWLAGFRAGLGAMTADACFLVLSLLGVVTAIDAYPRLRGLMVLVGGGLMWYFAVGAVESARDTFGAATAADRAASGKGFRKAFVLALTNPYQILFWLTVGVGLLAPGTIDVLSHTPYVGADLAGLLVVRTGSPTLLVGFFAGIGLWITGFPAALVAAERRMASLTPVVAGVSALVLGGFGTLFLWDGLTTLV
ncbi:LysE family transporter [Halobacteriales archaeon Cl-PHB]